MTVIYFREVLADQKKDAKISLEFGSSSFYGSPTMYTRTEEGSVILDHANAKEFYKAMRKLGDHLGFQKD